MKLAVVTLNSDAIALAQKIREHYQVDIYTMEKYLEPGLLPLTGGLKANMPEIFTGYDCIIFVMAIGIIVREIAPFIKHKSTDPAILSLTIDGKYIIPVLSGHLGGANKMATDLQAKIGAIPVITTASDILNKKAVDLIAKDHNLVIDNFKYVTEVTSLIVNSELVETISEVSIGIDGVKSPEEFVDYDKVKGLVYISYKTNLEFPVPMARLIPKRLVLGIGAKRDTTFKNILELLNKVLESEFLDIRAINKIVSIDIKKDEVGIIELAEYLNIPFNTYTSTELNTVVDKFDQSDFVRKITGVGAVSMPSGYLGSNRGECLIQKVAENGITISIWERSYI